MSDKRGTQSGGLMSEAGLVQYVDNVSENAILIPKNQMIFAILGLAVLMIGLHTFL
jgi:preprotein translocase subunit Sec61beta